MTSTLKEIRIDNKYDTDCLVLKFSDGWCLNMSILEDGTDIHTVGTKMVRVGRALLRRAEKLHKKDVESIMQTAGEPRTVFGVVFSNQEWGVLTKYILAPLWELNPPQREEYDSDHDYAYALKDYANKLIVHDARQG